MVPKILFLKSTRCKLFNAVSTFSIAILDQKLQPTEKKYVYKINFKNGEISQIFSNFEQDNKRWYEDIRNGFEKLKPHTLRLWIA